MHRTRQDGAANDDGVPRTFTLQCLADLLADPSYISQVEIAVRLARCTHANEGQFRLADRFDWIAGSAQPAGLGSGRDDLADIGFNDGRLSTVDQIDFGGEWIHTNDFMSIIGETSRRDRSDITQSENADSQNPYLSLMLSGLELAIC